MTTRASTGGRSRSVTTKRRTARETRGRRPGPARWPWRCARGPARRRSGLDRARRCSRAARGQAGRARPGRGILAPWWPGLAGTGRSTPRAWWPVLAASLAAGRHAHAPRRRPPSDSRWPSPGGRPSPLRCAAATNPVVPAPGLVVVCARSRHCSSRLETSVPRRRQRLDSLRVVAGFRCPSVAGFGCPPRCGQRRGWWRI